MSKVISYNLNNLVAYFLPNICFVNAFGQFNNIRYHHNSTSGYLNDWFVNTSFGIRL